MNPGTQDAPAHARMFQLLNGGYVAGALSCLARLGIPDLVANGPKSAQELAVEIGADPRALYRLMRATACVGVLFERPDGTFSQTPLSALLRRGANPGLRGLAMMSGLELQQRAWCHLEYSVRTGKPATDQTCGLPVWEYFKQHPEEAAVFNEAMTGISMVDSPAVADAYSFEGLESIVDVAGGHGFLLATILAKHRHLRGTLFDQPHVVEEALTGPLKPVADRCTVSSGDMFESVPVGADAYIMKHIIHDWPDDLCVKLLKSVRAAVNPRGKLLVVDAVIAPGNDFSPGKFLDLQMMLLPGGCERTEEQFRELFVASGWSLNRVIPTGAASSIVEGAPA